MPNSQFDPERGWIPAEPMRLSLGVRFGMAVRKLWRRFRARP